ncbi:TolB family protein [Gracilimonas halophila]|uniref:TolB family protein n=1 Tax=Gracilimonas halophila TaxID=1834464 RepID=A0ABW5JGH5_9BACT
MDSDGSNPIRLIENEAPDYYPKYSSSAHAIAFSSNVQIWTMSENGGGLRQLTFGERGTMPDWSPDGQQIIYSGPKGAIWVMDKDGSNQIPLTFRPEGKIY